MRPSLRRDPGMTGKTAKRVRRGRKPAIRRPESEVETGKIVGMVEEVAAHSASSPRLTGGDVDADWKNAWDAGDEAVGGSTATPDQDVVDELGEALGVPQEPDAEVTTSAEILAERDRHRWALEAEDEADRE
jgi:hypothetical protein